MIEIRDVIDTIKSEASWVNYDKTRDVFLTKEKNQTIDKIGVCWVATKQALQQAKENDIHFIISHENFLYLESTSLWKGYLDSRNEKIDFCLENDISVYRLHDGWDMYPFYGVADSLNKLVGIDFEARQLNNYHTKALINGKITVKEIAQKYADALSGYGCQSVEIFGDPDKKVNVLATGIGAATSVPEMSKMGADCMIVADDGGTNWTEHQWCLDNDISLILLHHSVNEIPGIYGMKQYLESKFPEVKIIKLEEGYQYHTVLAKK